MIGFGMIGFGMIGFGMIGFGMIGFGMIGFGMIVFGMIVFGMVQADWSALPVGQELRIGAHGAFRIHKLRGPVAQKRGVGAWQWHERSVVHGMDSVHTREYQSPHLRHEC